MAFLTIITNAGLKKVRDQIAAGKSWTFSSVQFSSDFSAAGEDRESLTKLEERFAVASVSKSGESILRVEGQPTSARTYLIREVGLFISDSEIAAKGFDTDELKGDEVLFAIQASSDGLGTAIAGQKNIFSYDLELDQKPLQSLEITGPGNNLNLFLSEEMLTFTTVVTTLTERLLHLEQKIARLERR